MFDELRKLPSVDRLVQTPELARLSSERTRLKLVIVARGVLEQARAAIRGGGLAPGFEDLVAGVSTAMEQAQHPGLRRVINATGVIIHTNLGRAPLSEESTREMVEVCAGYSNLEFELETGERGSRQTHVEALLCELTGAEAGLVVNNNAGAVLLALAALAAGREVIVSRGQAVEIGGGFRIPDVMLQSSATLVEVGTTNRTYLRDYEAAITESTALLLHVHSSNFRISGFTHSVGVAELGDLAARRGVLLLDDIGSGALLDTQAFELAHEPQVQESVANGATVVCFSGDKLLGGPQAGLVVGRREAIDALRNHPLARALRIDKADLAGLEATLRHYALGEAVERIPVWRMIAAAGEGLKARAVRWMGVLNEWGLDAEVLPAESTIGGGSLPGETLPTWVVAVTTARSSSDNRPNSVAMSAVDLATALRRGNPPIIGRIERSRLLLDPRTVLPEEDDSLLSGLRLALSAF